MIHLLKQKSKEVPQQRKRIKRSIFATPNQFKQLARESEEQKFGEVQAVAAQQVQNHSFQQPADNSGALPNVIGNLEDLSVNEHSASFLQKDAQADANAGASFSQRSLNQYDPNENMYRPVTPMKTHD